ncbi:MAG: sigma factor-like helix-turn-helix DNA-binding protein [Candidatus Omnitrophota bacterium]|jgi:predicted DNA-binding protein (UPF0251 family)
MAFHRKCKDSAGHSAEIILFSEFRNEGHSNPTPEDIVFSIFQATPGMTGGGGSRYNQDVRRKYLSALRWAISMLSKKQKRVIYLKFYLNLKNSEIADKLGINRQAVPHLLNSATENMRSLLVKGKTVKQAVYKKANSRRRAERWQKFKSEMKAIKFVSKEDKAKVIALAKKVHGR